MLKRNIKSPPTCNVCNGALKPRFDRVRDPITNESFAILSCTECDLGHTFPQPADLSRYYGQQYYGSRHGITSRLCVSRRLRFLERIAGKTTRKQLLDVGSGDGSFLLGARRVGWKVTGTELNPLPARSFGLDVRHTLDHINQVECFDCITMWHSLEHMKDIKSTLILIARLLAPQGHLIIAVPNNSSLQAKLCGPRWLHLDVPRHLFHFNPGSLRFSLEKTGFRVCRFRHHEIEYNVIGWSQSAMNYLNPTPNVFFDLLTGKGRKHSVWAKTTNLILGSILALVSSATFPVEGMIGGSGTLIFVCRKE